MTEETQRRITRAQCLPELQLTPEHTISHSLWLAGEHWNTEPVDVDIGGKANDTDGEEYGKFEEDPGLRFGSPFTPLLPDVIVELSATTLLILGLLVRCLLCHLMRIGVGESASPTLAGGGCVSDHAVGLGLGFL